MTVSCFKWFLIFSLYLLRSLCVTVAISGVLLQSLAAISSPASTSFSYLLFPWRWTPRLPPTIPKLLQRTSFYLSPHGPVWGSLWDTYLPVWLWSNRVCACVRVCTRAHNVANPGRLLFRMTASISFFWQI